MRMDWQSSGSPNPSANQKYILRILAISRIAQISIEKLPRDLVALIRLYCGMKPITGATTITKLMITPYGCQ